MESSNDKKKKCKVVKKQHIKIVLLDYDEYKKVRKPTDTLEGRTDFKKPDKDDVKSAVIQSKEFKLLEPKKNNSRMYYTQLDIDGKWIQYEDDRSILFILLFILLLALLGVFLCRCSNKPVGLLSEPSTDDYSLDDLLKNKGGGVNNSSIPSFNQLYVSSSDKVPLVNLSSNEWNIKYEVYDSSNKKVFETDIMSPGQETKWDVHKQYSHKLGSYQFTIKAILINPKTGESGNSQTFSTVIDLQ